AGPAAGGRPCRARRMAPCLATTAEQGAEEAAARGTLGPGFQLLDTRLRGFERLLLHQDGLREVVGGGRLAGDALGDVALSLGIPDGAVPLDGGELAEELVDDAPFVLIHSITPPAGPSG